MKVSTLREKKMGLSLLLFAILTLGVPKTTSAEHHRPKVAIIGGGIGGASASFFLTRLFKRDLDIDIFEAHQVGGRLATINVQGVDFEAGGSIIHPKNRYMVDFARSLGLKKRDATKDGLFGIWNGSSFMFRESSWKVITLQRLLSRYGLQFFQLNRYIDSILDDFSKIYELQDKGVSFTNVTAMFNALNPNFVDLFNTSVKEHFSKLDYSETLINELIEATTVVNYGQDTNIHAFVGAVALAGAGADHWAVKGGNKKVPEKLISQNDKVMLISGSVKKIRYIPQEESYVLTYQTKDNKRNEKKVYDIVIVATPLTKDYHHKLEFENFPNSANLQIPGSYQTTIAAFIEGYLNYTYFGLEDESLDAVLSCNPDSTIISSIGKLLSVNGDDFHENVWKIFARDLVEPSLLDDMFSEIQTQKQVAWKAYPHYSNKIRHDNFKLHDSLYHVNAIEWAASAMEMSAIGGRNVAILAHKDYIEKHGMKYSLDELENFLTEKPRSSEL